MLGSENRRGFLNAPEIASVVYVRNEFEILFGLRLDRFGFQHARVGNEHVKPTVGTHDLIDALSDRLAVGNVDRHTNRASDTVPRTQVISRAGRPLLVDIRERNVSAFGSEALGNLQPETLSRPGHNGDLAVQSTGRGTARRSDFLAVHLGFPVLDEQTLAIRQVAHPLGAST